MRILAINRFFGNDEVPTGRILGNLISILCRQGHQVTVLTSQGSYSSAASHNSTISGVTVRRLWLGGRFSRPISWFLFWFQACILAPFLKWDRCILLTDPPFLPIIAALTHWWGKRKRRIYWWTMDLYPEALVASGLIKENGLPHRLLRGLNNLGMFYLDGVISLGPTQKKRLTSYRFWQKNPGFSLTVSPWDYRSITSVEPARNRFLRENDLTGCRIALYAGNLGQAHSYSELLQAARTLAQPHPEWKIVFVVRGSRCSGLARQAMNMSNVIIIEHQPEDMVNDLLWAADVHIITMKSGWEGIVIPSKLYGVLKTTAPVLFIGPLESEIAQEIKRYNIGSSLEVGSSGQDVARELIKLASPRRERILPVTPNDGAELIAGFITNQSEKSRRGL